MKELGKSNTSKSIWGDFINPDVFVNLEDEIKAEKDELDGLYKKSQPKEPADLLSFLEKEKRLIAKVGSLIERKEDLKRKYSEAIRELYKRIGDGKEDYPLSFEDGEKVYYFQLNFDPKEYKNPGREYYLEVSRSPSSGFERIRLQSDDSESRHKRKADEIIA